MENDRLRAEGFKRVGKLPPMNTMIDEVTKVSDHDSLKATTKAATIRVVN